MTEKKFNLLDENWIKVLKNDGSVEEVGLKKVFEIAHECISLAGELPTQDLAMMRLMIAILYAIYDEEDVKGNKGEMETEDDAYSRWNGLWTRGTFDYERISEYLEKYRERFYLFHPERPFYQAPIENGSQYTSLKLDGQLAESNNKKRLFNSRSRSNFTLSYPEAARWVVNLMNYDDASCKSKIKVQISPGWLGRIGPVYIEGNNLFETTVLNLVFTDNNNQPFGIGHPYWEKDNPDFSERIIIQIPETPVELMTSQCRRLHLLDDGTEVTGYLVLGGDVFPSDGVFSETMTAWSWYEKDSVWKPKKLDPSRSFWRDYSALVMKADSNSRYIRPGVIRWMSRLIQEDLIKTHEVRIRVAGATYDSQSSSVTGFMFDGIDVNREVLMDIGDAWNVRIDDVMTKTEKCVWVMRKSIENFLVLQGHDSEKKILSKSSEAYQSACYGLLDQPARKWLSSIDPSEQDMETKIGEWEDAAVRIIVGYMTEVMRSSNGRAIAGTKDDGNIFSLLSRSRKNVYSAMRGDKH